VQRPEDLCRELGVHQQTFYNWKLKYSGMEVDQLKELKRLQEENNRLKKMVADQALNIEVLKEVNSKKW
jgi:putative transposase